MTSHALVEQRLKEFVGTKIAVWPDYEFTTLLRLSNRTLFDNDLSRFDHVFRILKRTRDRSASLAR